MPSASAPSRPRGGRLPHQTYLPRAIGLGLGSIGMALALWELSRPAWVWVVLGFVALVWPHLAYLRATRSAAPYPAELQNIMLDAGLIGFVVCAAGFSLMPSAVGLTVAGMNSMAINGWRLWCLSLLATLAGLAAGLLAMPWVFAPTSSLQVQLACLPVLALYFPTIGLGTLKLARSLRKSRETLRQFGQVDGLSGLFNRTCLEERIAAACELRRTRPAEHPRAALLLLDVDHFKQINDTAGHAMGDAVIRHMGEVLKATVRSDDLAARFDGDEFVVLLQDAGQDEAQAFVERMKSTLQHRQRSGDALPAFTLSTGIACYDASAPTPQSWMARADAALYTVKRRARGGVEICND
jgi:diguanylate cyclase